jgi:hypothetical protein
MSDFKHGESGYSNHRCRCEVCTTANAAANARYRAGRTARPLPPGRRHGVYTTYVNYGCRCERCKQANADKARARRAARRQP